MLHIIENYRQRKYEAQRGMTARERIADGEARLRFLTDFGLGVAVAMGIVVVLSHDGVRTAGIAAYGAALGLGGVLGFLFGVPSRVNSKPNIQNVETLTLAGDNGVAKGGNVVNGPAQPADQAAGQAPADAQQAAPANQPAAADKPFDGTTPYNPGQSNLEQVADWVTKLLLGGGLTQISKIPHKVWQWSYAAAVGIVGPTGDASPQAMYAAQSYAAGVLVYGFILGFFAGYLITKLQLGKAISG